MSDATNQLAKPGDVIVCHAAGATIQLQRAVDGGYSRNVFVAGRRIAELAAGHTDERIARSQCSQIRAALLSGITVDQIAVEHVANGQSVLAVAEEIVDEALRVATADPNTVQAEPTIEALQALKADDDADMDELAARVRATMIQSGALAPASTHLSGQKRQVAPTMAGAHLAPLSAPQLAAIDNHRNGLVLPVDGVDRRMLRSMARKGYGDLNYGPAAHGKPAIRSLTLNARGLAKARTAVAL